MKVLKFCLYCNKMILGSRSDAKFCVDNFGKCRVAYHRLQKRAKKLGYVLPAETPGYVFDLDVLTAVAEGRAHVEM